VAQIDVDPTAVFAHAVAAGSELERIIRRLRWSNAKHRSLSNRSA
jgi:hypothetical protein